MTAQQPQPTPPSPPRPFQFSLRTLLLLFVVLGSSLAVFGGGGVVVFGLAVGLAIYLHRARSFAGLGILLVLSIIPAIDVLGLALAYLLPMISAARESGNWRPYLRIVAALAVWLLSVGTLLVGAVRSRKARSG